jgi:enoyl-CoA hydratase
MQYKNLLLETRDGILTVKINRPKALNALNPELLVELKEVFQNIPQNPEVKSVIITGEGEKAFIAGADIAAMKEMTALQAKEFCGLGHEVMRLIETCPRPVIAAVNGFCLGGGLELALSCDFIYASETAKLGLPEVNLGLFPGFGGTQRLSRLVGKNLAKELIFTAKTLGAQEAFSYGMVNKVCPQTELISSVETTAKEIMQKGPIAIELAKKVINEGTDLDIASGLAMERNTFPIIFATEDKSEGVGAFLEKRKPNFSGS